MTVDDGVKVVDGDGKEDDDTNTPTAADVVIVVEINTHGSCDDDTDAVVETVVVGTAVSDGKAKPLPPSCSVLQIEVQRWASQPFQRHGRQLRQLVLHALSTCKK